MALTFDQQALANLQTAYSQLQAQFLAMTLNTLPTITVQGQTVDTEQHAAGIMTRMQAMEEQILYYQRRVDGPFELLVQGYT